ncbi:hypothetical protein KP509_30G002600 [Ceratopteris richardii]|nr:hypothetical protein KP509_30G002600 [Ceratopteris richardii]
MPTFPPNSSFNFSCAVVGDSLYAIGGFAGLSENAMKMPVYNLRTNMWMEANQIKGLREAFACGVIGGRIYVAGGFCRQKSKEKMLRSAEMYIPERDIWCPVASMCQGRSCCASAVVGDKLFVIGGYGAQTVLRTVEVYDPAENSWEQKTSMPRMWILAGCASVGTKIYVVGSDIRAMDRQELAVFDTQLDSWNKIGLIPFNELVSGSKCSLWGCGVASVGEQLYIAGGASSYDGGGLNTVLVYDPGTEQWGTMRQMHSRRHCCAVVTIYH